MQSAILRFTERLQLPSSFKFNLEYCVEVKNDLILSKFKEHMKILDKPAPILELYHASRDGISAIKSISEKGFRYSYNGGNKGSGVYLANHSRYSAFWVGHCTPVIICHVIGHDNYIQRYKSEVISPNYDSEFVITNPNAIYPKYILGYKLINFDRKFNYNRYNRFGYVPHGAFGCHICDPKKIRCDCQQHPVVLESDICDEVY